MAKKRVLCVGLVCLDEINVVSSYPIEDTDQRSVDRYTARGGNASNSSTVLASIGEAVECFATLANKDRNTSRLPLAEYFSSTPVSQDLTL